MATSSPSLLLCILTFASCALCNADDSRLPFRDPDLPVEKRVDDLVSRLTVDEKIAQLMMATPAIPRLGIPAYDWWNEALHGVARNGVATVFPQAIALAATWNPELHQRIADAISTEARAKNNEMLSKGDGDSARYAGLTIWSPNINIFRDPRWGRGQETYGEDPFLTGRFAVAFVRGLEGNDPHYLKAVATVKHFAVHSGPESLRHQFNAVISDRDLRETYLPAFEAGIREGHAWSLMSAYNAIDGIPAPANKFLLTDVLRGEWGFKGAVVGDVDTVADILNGHHYTKDVAESSADALKAGTDLCSGRSYTALPDALKRGLVTEADLDTALRRLFLLRFKLGQFDPADRVPYRKIPISENDSSSHSQLALEAARQSLVLLKNDGTLPWDVKTIKTLAVIGPTADSMPALVGNYNGTPSHPVTLLHGLKARLEPQGVHVLVADGAPLVKGFREACKPFPAGVLFTDRQRTQPGLAGEVFSNPDFQGNPSAKRLDAEIDLKWGSFDPLPEVPVKGASIRWTGILVPPVSGDYILSITVKGSARLRMDGKVVIDAWRPGNERTMTAVVPLVAGQSVAIALEFAETMDGGRILLGWKTPADDHELDDALAAARQADHIVLALGLTPQLEGEEMSVHAEGFSGGDRTSILLPASQGQLLSAVAALGKPFTVVLTNGSALSFDISKPNAVLEAWYYGERGGDAITDALLGDTNPGGRLPVTFYRSDSDLPPFVDYSMANRTYRYFRGKPLFAFGYGLSYTTFRYTQLRLSSDTAGASGSVTADVSVTNTGSRAGDEVVELYARAVNPPVPMPLQQLVGFERVPLQPGETKVVELHVPVATLRRWDDGRKAYTVDPGEYELRAGGASDAPAVKSTLRVQ